MSGACTRTRSLVGVTALGLLLFGCEGMLVRSPDSPPDSYPRNDARSGLEPGPGPAPLEDSDSSTSNASDAPDAADQTQPRPQPSPTSSGFLRVQDDQLVDDSGAVVRLTGVNWFGFETANMAPHGLWARDYRSMLGQIRAIGFNTMRLPLSNAILADSAKPQSINFSGADPHDGTSPMNAPLKELSALQLLDAIVDEAGKQGLRVILDNHARAPDGYMGEELWYTASVSEQQWIDDWVFLAARYQGNPTVVGLDLNNEPHGQARWGEGGDAVDWRAAAERCGDAILAVNPDVLIIVEGVEQAGGSAYWWGGNLKGVASDPVQLSKPDKLLYSTHEYGPEVFQQPWFSDPAFPDNLEAIWDAHFGFIMRERRGHVLVGEFGIKDAAAFGGASRTWIERFLAYAGDSYSWTFWCWNPNSGDTGGILTDDWTTTHAWKVELLEPHLAKQ